MLTHLLSFVIMLMFPDWMQDKTPDENHFHRRRFTPRYRLKLDKAKYLWIAALSLVLLFPYPPIIVGLLLFTTFVTFSLMDESN